MPLSFAGHLLGAGRKAPPSRPGIDALCQSEYYLAEAVPIPPVLIDRASLRSRFAAPWLRGVLPGSVT